MIKKNMDTKLFDKFEKIIFLLVYIDSFLPRSINRFFFIICRNVQGKFGVLLRYVFLKNISKKCGNNVYVGVNVYLMSVENLLIGNNVSIHPLCYIDATGCIDIGDNVSIAHNSTILSTTHTYLNKSIPIKYNPVEIHKTTIEDNVWIGCGVRILCGVRVRENSIIAAGAVVIDNTPEESICGGVPAKLLKLI